MEKSEGGGGGEMSKKKGGGEDLACFSFGSACGLSGAPAVSDSSSAFSG